MNRRFVKMMEDNKKITAAVLTVGDPDIAGTLNFARGLLGSSISMLQFRIPFSDSVTNPALQRADARALSAGVTTDKIFTALKELRSISDKPLALEIYANMICTYGKERFFDDCVAAGVDGVIVVDLPYEERDEVSSLCSSRDIALVPLLVPASAKRICSIAAAAEGYIYLLPVKVSDCRKDCLHSVEEITAEVHRVSTVPVLVATGAATDEEVCALIQQADGVALGREIALLTERFGASATEKIVDYCSKFSDMA